MFPYYFTLIDYFSHLIMDFFAHHLFTSVEGPKISVLNFEKTVLCPEMPAMMLVNTFKILQLLHGN